VVCRIHARRLAEFRRYGRTRWKRGAPGTKKMRVVFYVDEASCFVAPDLPSLKTL
jgi:hypothetical protein